MLIILIPLILGSTLFALMLLMVLSGDFRKFKANFTNRPPKITEIPLITPTGQIVNSVEELDMHLEFLRSQLEEKQQELEESKAKMSSTEDNLKRLTDTSSEIRKYYVKLRTEIARSENDCTELKAQIEDYKNRQMRLREEVNENVKYYTHLLSNIDSGTVVSSHEDYELVKKMPPIIQGTTNTFTDKFGIL